MNARDLRAAEADEAAAADVDAAAAAAARRRRRHRRAGWAAPFYFNYLLNALCSLLSAQSVMLSLQLSSIALLLARLQIFAWSDLCCVIRFVMLQNSNRCRPMRACVIG